MKTAVVTGASYGLGKSIAEMLLANDFKIYGISRTESTIKSANFVWIKGDLTNSESCENIRLQITEDVIDLLINNAGIVEVEKALEFKDETFKKIFGLNFTAPIKLTSILKSKLQNGMIINISSTSDRFVDEGLSLYCASKAALDIYFDGIALENKEIKVINILPVYIDTPMLWKLGHEQKFSVEDATDPAVLADAIKEIAFSNNSFISGVRIMVLSNKSLRDAKDPEKLYYYNVDTKKFVKLK